MSLMENDLRGRSESEVSIEDAIEERIPDGGLDPQPMRAFLP